MPNEIQRVNYHTGLFLEEAEFKLEQNYHLLMRRRLNYALFTPGVLYGLSLSLNSQTHELTVNPGMAIDEITVENGETISREIIVINPHKENLFGLTGDVWITICHDPIKTDKKPPTNLDSRITENYKVETLTSEPKPLRDKILLAKIKIGETFSNREPIQKSALKLWNIPTPVVTRFFPEEGKPKDAVEIHGGHFIGTTQLLFADESAEFEVWSDTLIKAKVPENASTGKIRVISPVGYDDSDTDFILKLEPTITDFDPKKTNIGAYVLITGTNLTGATNITFGDRSAEFQVDSSTRITAKVPVNTPTHCKITVTTPAGSVSSTADFEVLHPIIPQPKITDFDPKAGVIGTVVKITGTSFTNASKVLFGNVPSNFILNSDTQITTSVPSGAATGRIAVVTLCGIAISSTEFKVNIPAPKITSFEPGKGTIGTRIEIKGLNFLGKNLQVVFVLKETAIEGESGISRMEERPAEHIEAERSGIGIMRMPVAARTIGTMGTGGGVVRRTFETAETVGRFFEREETEFPLVINSVTDTTVAVTIPRIKLIEDRESFFRTLQTVDILIRVRTDSGQDTSKEPFQLKLIRG